MHSIRGSALIVCLALCTSGCSLFGPRIQTIVVSSDPTGALVRINGNRVGESPLQTQVSRGEDLLIEIRHAGYETQYRNTHRALSTVGMVDAIGGCIILVPFVGLLSSAAWEHEPSVFGFTLSPADEDSEEAAESSGAQ